MNKKENLLKEQNAEMLSLNEGLMNIFAIEELEQRLQMSAAKPWCSTNCGNYSGCESNLPNCPSDAPSDFDGCTAY